LQNLENIINFLKQTDELQTAHQLLSTFEKYSNSLEQFDALGRLFHDVKAYPEALRCTEKCLMLAQNQEQQYNIRCNLIKIYNEINEPQKALRLIKANQCIFPDDVSMKMEMNFSYFLLNNKEQSEKILRELLEEDITEEIRAKINFNLGTYDLEAGKFQQGLRGFILAGKSVGIWPDDGIPSHLKVSDENPLDSSKSLLIKADGGIGDELINIRFMKDLPNATWLTTRQDLADIFNRCGFKAITYKEFEGYQEYDQVTTSMQLPIWLNLKEEQIWQGRCLEPSEKAKEKFKYMDSSKMKIGLRWSGNNFYEQNLHRSLDFEELYSTVKEKYPDADLYSLQFPKDESVDYKDVIDMSTEISNFDDTLAIIDNLDLVITSCTSVAHAAGALDKNTVVFAPISAYYTWDSPHSSREHNESIWYSKNLKVLKQDEHKSWKNQYKYFK